MKSISSNLMTLFNIRATSPEVSFNKNGKWGIQLELDIDVIQVKCL